MTSYLKEKDGKLLCPDTLITIGYWFKVDSTIYYMLEDLESFKTK
tara:strand:+ start:173 stop:307 length:135 start_codon:yes stop_codon:yes gene_type:complete